MVFFFIINNGLQAMIRMMMMVIFDDDRLRLFCLGLRGTRWPSALPVVCATCTRSAASAASFTAT
jgi:hypothetical protein